MSASDAQPLAAGPAQVPALAAARRPYLDLVLVSFLILFLELACIRWLGATVVFLTFFTNIVLMACFLGMSVGCLAAGRKSNLVVTVAPLALATTALGLLVLWAYFRFGRLTIDVGGQQSPQLIYFGTEYRAKDPGRFIVPIEAVAGLFFVLVALMFVGLGQVMGRAFDAISNRVGAYLANIAGSLAGIVGFAVLSWLEVWPVWWFAVCFLLLLRFVPRRVLAMSLSILAAGASLAVVGVSSYWSPDEGQSSRSPYQLLWSPYYKVRYRSADLDISTNNIAHQQMQPVAREGPAYSLPHLLARDLGAAPFGDVLVIGAGSGNDVAAALAFGARHVDAVEIDPVIYRLGRQHHPDQPYDDPRVTVYLDDGRSFLKKTSRNYDLVIYALVDSLVLHSGHTSLRLESFLFTQEALADVRDVLKPEGVFAMYNYYRQGWVVGRLARMAGEQFGSQPLVMSLPYQAQIRADQDQANVITFVLAGRPGSPFVSRLRQRFDADDFYWLNSDPRHNTAPTFGPAAPPQPAPYPDARGTGWLQIGPAVVQTRDGIGLANLPADDWPSLYLREAVIPGLSLRGMAVITVLSLALLLAFAPAKTLRPNGQMFFLGAGFMLLETKGVVHMALLCGATWVVNSIVFFAILVMIALANLFVLGARPRKLWPYYALLVAALLVNAVIPMSWFLELPGALKTVASCAVIFVPIFFAGVIFATCFRDSKHPDADLGANIAGVVLGGLSEFLSLMLGFNGLIYLAIGYYLLSALLRSRPRALT